MSRTRGVSTLVTATERSFQGFVVLVTLRVLNSTHCVKEVVLSVVAEMEPECFVQRNFSSTMCLELNNCEFCHTTFQSVTRDQTKYDLK